MKEKKKSDKRPRDSQAPRHKAATFLDVPVDLLIDPALSMRIDADDGKIKELADSIDKYGLINAISIRKAGSKFEVVAGHRRMQAVKTLGWATCPARLEYGDDVRTEMIKIHENIIREDVNVIEESEYLSSVMKKLNMTQTQLAAMIGKSAAYVTERIKINKWSSGLRAAVMKEEISFSAARELATIKDESVRGEMIKHAVKSGVSPATAKQWADDANEYGDAPVSGAAIGESVVGSVIESMPRFACEVCGVVKVVNEFKIVRCCASCKSALASVEKDTPEAVSSA